MELANYDIQCDELESRFLKARQRSVDLCAPLTIEDYVVQPFEHVSPPKWHLAHTTWFYERFILGRKSDYRPFNDKYNYLFNSYYKTVGEHWQRGARGSLSRPGVEKILEYRFTVDERIKNLISHGLSKEEEALLSLGIQHEQQHQELLLMDIKSVLSFDPELRPYAQLEQKDNRLRKTAGWKRIEEGCYEFGSGHNGFSFDNERPVHKRHLRSSEISENLVTNGEYLEFIQDKGYERAELWMSKGWDWVQEHGIKCPLYWSFGKRRVREFTLYGEKDLVEDWPVQHISFFEADAFARWKKARLPSEFELEKVFANDSEESHEDKYHATSPFSLPSELWAWTQDQYTAYPGYQSYEGSLGEYNRKFMCNQFVLRGGCIATPKDHYRNTYRNFYEPDQRWMFSGIRLARDA